jgi:hypothetical protein
MTWADYFIYPAMTAVCESPKTVAKAVVLV